jgi:hypothetical protein
MRSEDRNAQRLGGVGEASPKDAIHHQAELRVLLRAAYGDDGAVVALKYPRPSSSSCL